MEHVACYRCKSPIKGEFKIVNGKVLGPSCFKLYEKRNRIRSQCASAKQSSVDFIETEICKTNCLECQFFNLTKCPQEEAFKGVLGRRR